MNQIKENGFINYFGLQRFGSFTIKSHQIGVQVIMENWEEVIRLLVKSSANKSDESRKEEIIKLAFEDNEPLIALKKCQFRDRIERVVLESLVKHENGYLNAYQSISRNTRMIYVHAYQSYIWNKIVSHRLQKYGNEVLVGDIILSSDDDEVTGEDTKVEFVTEENKDKYTIRDIVFPLVGKSIELP